jgi:hypothetical protein
MQHLVKKITEAKRAGGMAQVVESLPSKTEALSSNPITTPPKQSRPTENSSNKCKMRFFLKKENVSLLVNPELGFIIN